MKITILGAGVFGRALGGVLENKGYTVAYYDPVLETSLEACLEGAQMMLLATPSSVVQEITKVLPKTLPLVVATKGILDARVFSDFRDVMVISGPGFASQIETHQAIKLTATDKRVVEMFETSYIDFDMTDDVAGVLMCGALKNVYAIGAGMRRLRRESEEWTEYVERSLKEMRKLLAENGGDAATVTLACGRGDVELTCGLPSRNFELGLKLSKDPSYRTDKTVEGLSALSEIAAGNFVVPDGTPILNELLEAEWLKKSS